MPKYLLMLFLAIVFFSCEKNKALDGIASKHESFDELITENELLKRIEMLNTPSISFLEEEGNHNDSKKIFENKIWWDLSRVIGFNYNKRLLFWNGHFIVHDMNYGTIIYGEYKITNSDGIECTVRNRHFVEKTDEYYYGLFKDYYKTFLEKDTVIFKFSYDSELYENQMQLLCLTDDSRYGVTETEKEIPNDNYYNLNGTRVYKYKGGLKKTIAKVNIRDSPTLEAKIKKVMDKNEFVDIVARVDHKEIIDGKEDFWYYVNYGVADHYIAAFGFVFGGYLSEKIFEYSEMTSNGFPN